MCSILQQQVILPTAIQHGRKRVISCSTVTVVTTTRLWVIAFLVLKSGSLLCLLHRILHYHLLGKLYDDYFFCPRIKDFVSIHYVPDNFVRTDRQTCLLHNSLVSDRTKVYNTAQCACRLSIWNVYKYMVCVYIYICVCVCVCIYIYIYVCMCLYIYIYIYMCVCLYIYIYCIYIYIYMCVCVCVYVKRNTPLGFCKRNVLNWISVLLCQLVTLYTIHDSWPCNRPSLTIFYLFIYAGMYGLHHWGGVGKILQHLVVR